MVAGLGIWMGISKGPQPGLRTPPPRFRHLMRWTLAYVTSYVIKRNVLVFQIPHCPCYFGCSSLLLAQSLISLGGGIVWREQSARESFSRDFSPKSLQGIALTSVFSLPNQTTLMLGRSKCQIVMPSPSNVAAASGVNHSECKSHVHQLIGSRGGPLPPPGGHSRDKKPQTLQPLLLEWLQSWREGQRMNGPLARYWFISFSIQNKLLWKAFYVLDQVHNRTVTHEYHKKPPILFFCANKYYCTRITTLLYNCKKIIVEEILMRQL